MPMSHASPARVPNFSYDTGSRNLNLLDSVVQKDMARAKRVMGEGDRVRPYAVDNHPQSVAPTRPQRRQVATRQAEERVPQHVATKRTNHLQNAPSQTYAPGVSKKSRVNEDSDPMGARGRLHGGASAKSSVGPSRINNDSNIFGPATPAYHRPPPQKREDFAYKPQGGHIRSTLPGQTDAHKFSDHIGSKFY